MRRIYTILLITISASIYSQNAIYYHTYSPTASSWDIIQWNVSDKSNHKWILKETMDTYGRVIELEFLKDGKLIEDPLCYLANRVVFEYYENRIIETLYQGNEELLATDCEMYFRTVYHLNKENYIIKKELFAKYDLEGADEQVKANWREWVPEYKIIVDSPEERFQIEYYYHSFAKMNGIYPVNKYYKFIDDYYYGDQPEKESIKKGIEKLKN